MRVLQLIDSLVVGGAETLLVDLCLRWKAHGLTPEVFALGGGDPAYQTRLNDAGISVTISPQPSLHSPGQARELARAIARGHFDLVHVHLYPAQLWAAMAIRITPDAPPAITTEHNTWNRRREYNWCRPIDRWMYSQFRLAVCIGTATRDNLESWIGPGVCPTCVVPNGVDLTRFHRGATPAQLPQAIRGAPTILCVGSLTDRKDQATLIRAIAEVEGVHLLLVGEGPLRQEAETVVRDSGARDRVHFLAVRHDIPELIAATDLYVQPSRVDGFCIAALEAMAGGLPVIASDIPGLRDLVGDSGLLFPAGDHVRLAECIRKVMLDPALAGQMARRGIDRAQKYSIEATALHYREIFEATVQKSRPTRRHSFAI